MSTQLWSFGLQWSRVGINAALFLVATRFLTLAEIGLFATAFAPVRLSQGLHRAGISESVIVLGKYQTRLNALFALSCLSGVGLTFIFGVIGHFAAIPALIALSAIPLLNGISAVPEGLLRRGLRLRALALRTIFIQSLAAVIALGLLIYDLGIWALVSFAVINALGNCLLTAYLARWSPSGWPTFAKVVLLLPKVTQIAARDFIGAAQMPLALMAIGMMLGLQSAGAFQIAARIYNLIDALTLSPLRFIALPQLAQDTLRAKQRFAQHLAHAAWLSSWIWAIVLLFAPEILGIVLEPEHAGATAPILRALAGLGFCSAVIMPVNQALTARLETTLVLHRAILTLCLSTALLLPALMVSAEICALALSIAAMFTGLWYVRRALPRLSLTSSDLSAAIPPLFAAGLACFLVLTTPNLPMLAQILCGTLVYTSLFALLPKPHLRFT
ncbi:oligosaccharide flippase family protein [Roseovarius rhodophyticola]|uniref:Oligosaccharide flippase family protein n=1 Tax=Roseovarius rhodophyticola TaxID=3080827 RepID=A0ABZ2TJH3_9RHOB|nr:oligosaccharide flippase family protein [Roseovarius sp. W115]MDV2930213.1 oligosaccharide flippase family protein [Roseovarius sp. W115]